MRLLQAQGCLRCGPSWPLEQLLPEMREPTEWPCASPRFRMEPEDREGTGLPCLLFQVELLTIDPQSSKRLAPRDGEPPLAAFLAGASLCLWSDYGEVVQSAHPDAWFFLGNQLTRHTVDVQLLIHNQEEAQEPSVSPAAIGICPVYRLIFQT